MVRFWFTALMLFIVVSPTGCNTSQVDKPASSGGSVGRIIFVGQKDACQCTRDRIDTSWAALEAVLGREPAVPVERIQLDVDAAKAEEYAKLKAIIVVPGIYFLDEKGKLVELLQGEVSPKQVTAVLQSAGGS